MTKGRVIKNYNGYYYVDVGRENLVECRRRGKLLKAKILVGDELEITELGQDKGVIEALLPRRNQIRRPAVANIDQLLVIMAAQSPDPNRFLVDKMLMTCEYGGIHPTLCFNKCDLDRDTAEAYKAFYERCGYDVYLVSSIRRASVPSISSTSIPGKSCACSRICCPTAAAASSHRACTCPNRNVRSNKP